MPRESLSTGETLQALRQTPGRIAALTDGIEASRLRAAAADGGWSANEVLAHLRACADVWGGCIETILAEDHPTIRAVNPRAWIKRTDYPEQEFAPSLEAFTTQRAELMTVFEGLTADQWPRSATLTHSGAPIERTLQSFAERLAVHERRHIPQIERIVRSLQDA